MISRGRVRTRTNSTRRLTILAVLAVSVTALGAGASGAEAPLEIVVSIPPQQWLLDRLVGGRGHVWSLLQPGDSAETYQPSDLEVTRALRARLFVTMGVPFERGAWARALRSAPGVLVVDMAVASSGHDHRLEVREAPHEDPHIWLSPRRLLQPLEAVTRALAQLDPDGADEYAERLAELTGELRSLDHELEQRLGPWRGFPFLVFHPSWSTFAHDYGLVELSVESHGQVPSDRELSQLLARARRSGIGTVFVQPQIAARPAIAIAEALGASVETLDPLTLDLRETLRSASQRLVDSFAATTATPGARSP